MAEVSHSGRRKPRPWTAQEQATLEVAAACGVSLSQIGAVLDRSHALLGTHVGPSSRIEARQAKAKYVKAWRFLNSQRHKSVSKAWRKKNQKQCNAKAAARYRKNRERYAAVRKAWREANRERYAAASKAWYEANRKRERYAAKKKAWREANRELFNDKQRRRRSRLRIARQFAQITYQQRQQRFALWSHHCAYCGADGKMTVDHVLAILHGGLDQPDNVVPACRSCNSSKKASPVEDWYRAQPFFTELRWQQIQQHCPAAVTGQLPITA